MQQHPSISGTPAAAHPKLVLDPYLGTCICDGRCTMPLRSRTALFDPSLAIYMKGGFSCLASRPSMSKHTVSSLPMRLMWEESNCQPSTVLRKVTMLLMNKALWSLFEYASVKCRSHASALSCASRLPQTMFGSIIKSTMAVHVLRKASRQDEAICSSHYCQQRHSIAVNCRMERSCYMTTILRKRCCIVSHTMCQKRVRQQGNKRSRDDDWAQITIVESP